MLTFLRKIRRSLINSGSARKYLIYAVGEIGLVVIGILIALQINNWNNNQQLNHREHKLVMALHTEFLSNSDYVTNGILGTHIKRIENTCRKILMYTGSNPKPIPADSFNIYIDYLGVAVYAPRTAKFEQVINGEDFNVVRNDSLRMLFANYKDHLLYTQKTYENQLSNLGQLHEYIKRNYSVRKMKAMPNSNWPFDDIGDTSFEFDHYVLLKDPYFENLITERLVYTGFWKNRTENLLNHIELILDFIERNYSL